MDISTLLSRKQPTSLKFLPNVTLDIVSRAIQKSNVKKMAGPRKRVVLKVKTLIALYRGSYMSDHVLLNLLNELRK